MDGARGVLLKKLATLRALFGAAAKASTGVHLDFSRTEKLHAEGMLLMVAEIRRGLQRHPSIELACTPSKNDKVCQVFEQLGLRDVLGMTKTVHPVDDDVVHWRFAQGSKVEGERYEDVMSEYDDRLAEIQQEMMYTGITEAMTNVVNHAYDELPVAESGRSWWMFSRMKDDSLAVTFCDLGLGIPRTLRAKRPNVWQRFVLLGRHRDASAIEYSVEDSISRTKLSHRGKGLGQIVNLAKSIDGAEVAIFSNAGLYEASRSRKVKKTNYRDSIGGTLIYWKIPLPDKEKS